jgi:hypothetical protein
VRSLIPADLVSAWTLARATRNDLDSDNVKRADYNAISATAESGMGRRAHLLIPTRSRVRHRYPYSTQLRARQGWIGLSGNTRISLGFAALSPTYNAEPAAETIGPFAMRLRAVPQ